jgi:hypothetical protein
VSVGKIFAGRSTLFEHDIGEVHYEDVDKIMLNHFLALVGTIVDYHGADNGENEFKIDDVVFKVVENPDDGYRSYLGTIEYSDDSKGIFFKNPIAQVKIETYDEECSNDTFLTSQLNQGYRLTDANDGHVWLEFGTHNYDDYYPCFIFRHYPKKP